jgi:hypothetical protein
VGGLGERHRQSDFPRDPRIELLGLHDHRLDAELGELLLDRGILDSLHRLCVNFGHDVTGGLLGHERADPEVEI